MSGPSSAHHGPLRDAALLLLGLDDIEHGRDLGKDAAPFLVGQPRDTGIDRERVTAVLAGTHGFFLRLSSRQDPVD
jgi:hypothetical protein